MGPATPRTEPKAPSPVWPFVPFSVFPMNDANGTHFGGPELPRVNDAWVRGRPYCFVYGYSGHAGGRASWAAAAIIKKNVCDPASPVLTWFQPNVFLSEPVVVPRVQPPTSPAANAVADPAAEDDAVLFVNAYDGVARESFLLILDARTLATVAELPTPIRLPWPIHGEFFPGDL